MTLHPYYWFSSNTSLEGIFANREQLDWNHSAMHFFLLFITTTSFFCVCIAVPKRLDYNSYQVASSSLITVSDQSDTRSLSSSPKKKYRSSTLAQLQNLRRNVRGYLTKRFSRPTIDYQLRGISKLNSLDKMRHELKFDTLKTKSGEEKHNSVVYPVYLSRNAISDDNSGSKTENLVDIDDREGSESLSNPNTISMESPVPPINLTDSRKPQNNTQNTSKDPSTSQTPPNTSQTPMENLQKSQPNFPKPQNTNKPTPSESLLPPSNSTGSENPRATAHLEFTKPPTSQTSPKPMQKTESTSTMQPRPGRFPHTNGLLPGSCVNCGLGLQGLENENFLRECRRICKRYSGQRCSRKIFKQTHFKECRNGASLGFQSAPTCCFISRCANMFSPINLRGVIFWKAWSRAKLNRCNV